MLNNQTLSRMKRTIILLSLMRCWLPVMLALFYSLTVSAQATTCNLVCNDHVNASMPADKCTRTFIYQDFLQNPDNSCVYKVSLVYPYGTNANPDGISVDRSHIGYTFIYRVTDSVTRNSCWGYVTVEDKAGPQPLCKNAKVSCFQVARLTEIVGQVQDNCGQLGAAAIEKMTWTEFGCNDVRGLGQVVRSIRTWDEWGNTSTCTDTLTIGRDSLNKVKAPDLIQLGCRITCKNPLETVLLSSVEGNAYYPSPKYLLNLQTRDSVTGGNKCVKANLKVVPFIADSVLVMGKTSTGKDTCFRVDSVVAMYPAPGGFCKTALTWKDQVIPICGTGFKIRREWIIADWCTGKDTTFVQYIKVEDKEKPILKSSSVLAYSKYTNPHDCYANFTLTRLDIDDCDANTKQSYIVQYGTGAHSGATQILSGDLPASVSLPAIVSTSAGSVTHRVAVSITDGCYNRTDTAIYVTVTDNVPPNPVCDEFTQTTVDPTTCWARVYAIDLDNGSRDNCCTVLHFAVAHMDTITYYTKKWQDYWSSNCNKNYWNNKEKYDLFLNDWINCFLFKDYIDLSECGTNQVVLRVYEACGVPRYDAHVFPCSEHDWFTYNTFGLCRAWHNYLFWQTSIKDCSKWIGYTCGIVNWIPANSYAVDLTPRYTGASITPASCTFYFPQPSGNANNYPPGNTCSARKYSDCMVNILVDDKTLPVCQKPNDKTVFCDGVSGENNGDAYSACRDFTYGSENYKDYTCVDYYGNAFNQIECVIENNTSDDTKDALGRDFGWYGCNIYSSNHGGDHDPLPTCSQNDYGKLRSDATNEELLNRFRNFTWEPIYCHTWLCLDNTDQSGKFDVTTLFDAPVARQGNPGSESAGSGKFWIWDNCTKPTITKADDKYVDNCGNGWYKRTWTASDKCNNKIVCEQKLIVKHRSDFEVIFPEDKIVACDASGGTSPDVLGRPVISDDECELVGVNYEDVRYDIVPDACYKIVRTWKLIDWCKFDPNAHFHGFDVIVNDTLVADKFNRFCVYRNLKDDGDGYVAYTQIIKVVDNKKPKLTVRDTTICLYTGTDGNCTASEFSVPFKAKDNCTPDNLISYRWEADLNASASDVAGKTYNAASIDARSGYDVKAFTSNTIKDGTHIIHVFAKDNCGNEDTSAFILIVKDCKKPTPYCFNGIATVIMPSTGEIVVWASDLNAGSYDNCTKKSDLRFSFDKEGNVASRTLKCSDIPNGISATIPLDIYVWDLAGNSDFCNTYILLQDGNGNKCPDRASSLASIAGQISTENKDAVEKVAINVVTSSAMAPYATDIQGAFAFKNLPINQSYSIVPSRDDDPMNGVSTQDLVLIQRHILGTTTLTSPYKIIAADVDNNKDITALDLLELRKLILGVYDKLPNNTSWRFVPKSFDFNGISTPLNAGFPEKLDISNLTKDELNKDFVGIKIGDLNSSVVPHSLLGAEVRESAGILKLRIADRELKAGEEATIDFTADNFANIEGFQYSLNISGLVVKDIKAGALKIDATNFGMTKMGQGYITNSWNEKDGKSVSKGEVLFSLKVKAGKAVTLSDVVRVNSRYTRAEAYNNEGVLNVGLEFTNNSASKSNYALYQNTPNPFKSQTVIGFDLAKNEPVTIKVTDLTGRNVRTYSINGVRGANQLSIHRGELGAAGVLYYTIETKSFSETKKMLLVD